MANVLCLLVVLMRVFLTASVGLYQDFIMITDFSNKVLKNNPTEVFQISTRSLLECSAQCGRHCNCFGFNKLTKVCRVFKTCDWAAEMESEDGWTYHSIKESDCDSEWMRYNGHCYFRNTTKMTQPEAMNTCNFHGGYLVEIDDEEENAWISQTLLKDVYCTNKYECTTWSGANDIDTEGVFIWEHSRSSVSYTNWDGINPDNHSNSSEPLDCVDVFYNGEWNDRPCAFLAAFICEK